MTTPTHLLLVPHTHWDREWYLTFQQFRMRLVHAVDKLLEVLEKDPAYAFFMLDGQTIVLDDYLEVRPENTERLQALARQGRILVGPWYLQPDEFLVGGESLIRNLQVGFRTGQAYGGVMPMGYVPDTFGHIAQLPQILRGFGLDNAVYWRGVRPEITMSPFRWAAPDGTEVLTLWLNDEFGYSNAARLPLNAEALVARISLTANRLRPSVAARTLLLMNGTDHMEPEDGLTTVLAEAEPALREHGLEVTIGTLPQYLQIVREECPELPLYSGEMRSSYYAHLLPAVLSTRMWLKQRNAAGEALLTSWAEPATAWAWLFGDGYPAALMRLAWKHLLQNHPHDSICGCSIDTVHREMIPRFEQSEQIGQELTKRALDYLTERVDTRGPADAVPVVVFNPASGPRTDVIGLDAQLPFSRFEVRDAEGHILPYQTLSTHGAKLFDQEVEKSLVLATVDTVSEGRAMGYVLRDAHISQTPQPGTVLVELTISEHGEPDRDLVERARAQVMELAARDDISTFRVIAREAKHTDLLVLVHDVPARGGRVLFICPRGENGTTQSSATAGATTTTTAPADTVRAEPFALENAHLRVMVDRDNGSLSLRDKRTGQEYASLNGIEDGGDVGDLYTFCPPANETRITEPAQPPHIQVIESGPARATLRVSRVYSLPARCTDDRQGRSQQHVECLVVSDVSLVAGARRVEIVTTVENAALDHRLRVLFPTPFAAETAAAEGIFEVASRPARLLQPSAEEAPDWAELPVDTHPHKRFVDVSDGERGLAVLNRGLPEYELVPAAADAAGAGSTVVLTLLRCVDWLSREDLATRRGHAGPMLHTPEAQGLGKHVFEYALVPHAGDWQAEEALVPREAAAFESPMRTRVTERHEGALRDMWSFVHVAPAGVAVSSVKKAEREDALVVRLYNPTGTALSTEVILAKPFREVVRVNLNEDSLPDTAGSDLARILNTGVRTHLRVGEIQTLLFRLA